MFRSQTNRVLIYPLCVFHKRAVLFLLLVEKHNGYITVIFFVDGNRDQSCRSMGVDKLTKLAANRKLL